MRDNQSELELAVSAAEVASALPVRASAEPSPAVDVYKKTPLQKMLYESRKAPEGTVLGHASAQASRGLRLGAPVLRLLAIAAAAVRAATIVAVVHEPPPLVSSAGGAKLADPNESPGSHAGKTTPRARTRRSQQPTLADAGQRVHATTTEHARGRHCAALHAASILSPTPSRHERSASPRLAHLDST